MSANIKYSPLPTQSESDAPLQLKKSKFACPKVSRFKLLSFAVVITISLVLVILSCFHSSCFIHPSVCDLNRDQPQLSEGKGKNQIIFSHMKRRLPQCIIIGARKVGTRALITYLNIHPDVVTKGEELDFFDDDYFYNQSLESYRKKMPPSYDGQLTVEKTPAYFTELEVPERVYRMNRTIKLLLILRDPVERALSDYLQIAENKASKNKPVASFEEHCLDKSGRINKSYKAISRSVYHRHLERWLELFDMSQIHIIDSEDLVNNPAAVMMDVEDFLQLEHKIKPSHFFFSEEKGFYCVKMDTVLKCLGDNKGRQHPVINEDVRKKLVNYFAPHNRKLFNLIGRTFDWAME